MASKKYIEACDNLVKAIDLANDVLLLAVVSGEKAADGSAQILSITDYYPFGMEMDGKMYVKDGGYRYGFNGQENVSELGNGHTTALYWEYDGRLGRRWNVDPVPVPELGNYVAFGNDPLQAEVDHIIPRSKGGSNTSDNVQILSKEQNLRKLDH